MNEEERFFQPSPQTRVLLSILGIFLIFIGIVLILLGLFTPSEGSKVGGLILIGPIPLFFEAGGSALMILLFLLLPLLFFLILFLLFMRFVGSSGE